MSNSQKLLSDALALIKKYKMLASGDKVLAAVSGGADSVCLLNVLCELKQRLNITVYAAHLNHMIRGDEAERDEAYVRRLCNSLGVKCFVRKADVPKLAEEQGLTLEEAGRKARYDFFAELRQKENIDKIATAHNKNDCAETVLMRIIRGTGIDGLGGISYTREDGVIRPLLSTERKEIESYLAERNIDFCTDSTNSDNTYMRNRIRNELIPYLEKSFNPKITDTLIRFSEIASEDARFLNGYAERLCERINNPLPKHKPYALYIETLLMLESSIRSRLVRITAKKVIGDVKLEHKHICRILSLLEKNSGTSVDLPFKLRVKNEYGWLIFESTAENAEESKKTVSDGEFFLRVYPLEKYYLEKLEAEISLKLVEPKLYRRKANEQLLDFDKLEGKKLILRSRASGDRIACFDDGRTKKIKSIFIDYKIPQEDRKKIPLLCVCDGDKEEIAAIVGLRVSEKYKITKETGRSLAIEYRKCKSDD